MSVYGYGRLGGGRMKTRSAAAKQRIFNELFSKPKQRRRRGKGRRKRCRRGYRRIRGSGKILNFLKKGGKSLLKAVVKNARNIATDTYRNYKESD